MAHWHCAWTPSESFAYPRDSHLLTVNAGQSAADLISHSAMRQSCPRDSHLCVVDAGLSRTYSTSSCYVTVLSEGLKTCLL